MEISCKSQLYQTRKLISINVTFLVITGSLSIIGKNTIFQYVQKEQLEFGELDWLTEIGMFGDQVAQETLAAAEVPQLPVSSQSSAITSYRPNKYYMPSKKPRIEISDDDDDHFTVPDFTVPDLG